MVSINKLATKVAKEIIENADRLGCKAYKMQCGVNVIDMGVKVKGSWEAGLLYTRATIGDLGNVKLGEFKLNEEYTFAAVDLYIDEPLIACLASQIAGWKLGMGDVATIGTGPARAQAQVDGDWYLAQTPYRDHNDEVVLCIQDIKLPAESIGKLVAKECKVAPENVYILVAPSNCIVGSMQVAARMCEQVCHKMFEKGFPVSKVVACRGNAPIAPIVKDEVKAMGRINDAILYGGETEFWVDATDVEIAKVIHQLVSKTSSPYYKELFEKVFVDAGKDFFYVDHDFHSIAKITMHNINTGKAFSAGEIAYEVLEESFLN